MESEAPIARRLCKPHALRVSVKGRPVASSDHFDSDALDFLHVPAWYDRHPSQAEGEDA